MLQASNPKLIKPGYTEMAKILDGYMYSQGPWTMANYRRGTSKFYSSTSMSVVLRVFSHNGFTGPSTNSFQVSV